MCASNDLHCFNFTPMAIGNWKAEWNIYSFCYRFTHQISSTPQNILVAMPPSITSAQGHEFCIYKCPCSTFLDVGSHFIKFWFRMFAVHSVGGLTSHNICIISFLNELELNNEIIPLVRTCVTMLDGSPCIIAPVWYVADNTARCSCQHYIQPFTP